MMDSQRSGWLVWAGVSVFFAILLGITVTILAVGEDEPAPPLPAEQPTTTIPESPTVSPTPFSGLPPQSVLASGRDEDFVFNVISIETSIPNVSQGLNSEVAAGSFTLITLEVTNTGDEQLGFLASEVKAIDTFGETFEPNIAAGSIVNRDNEALRERLDPDENTTRTIVFDIPDQVYITSIEALGHTTMEEETPGGVVIYLP
jgi:Domain of unknown function (DUF4352)